MKLFCINYFCIVSYMYCYSVSIYIIIIAIYIYMHYICTIYIKLFEDWCIWSICLYAYIYIYVQVYGYWCEEETLCSWADRSSIPGINEACRYCSCEAQRRVKCIYSVYIEFIYELYIERVTKGIYRVYTWMYIYRVPSISGTREADSQCFSTTRVRLIF